MASLGLSLGVGARMLACQAVERWQSPARRRRDASNDSGAIPSCGTLRGPVRLGAPVCSGVERSRGAEATLGKSIPYAGIGMGKELHVKFDMVKKLFNEADNILDFSISIFHNSLPNLLTNK